MRHPLSILINTPGIEVWPGGLLRARNNHDARILSRARHVLRRKSDGRYLAADLPEGLVPLTPRLEREPSLEVAMRALARAHAPARMGLDAIGQLPLTQLQRRLERLGLDEAYGERCGLPLVPEPTWLALPDT